MNTFLVYGSLAVLCCASAVHGYSFNLQDLGYYSTPNPPTLCGETLTADTGTISSPNYPNEYPNWTDCKWTITAPEGKRVALTFDALDINNFRHWPLCEYYAGDWVAVIDGRDNEYNGVLDHLCGANGEQLGQLPFTIASSSNSLTVMFFAGQDFTATGFSASYSFFECGGAFTEESGEFASPDIYMDWLTCEWTITAQEGKSIQLNFDSYDVEEEGCLDYVEIYDAGTDQTTKRCDNDDPTQIVSYGDLTIRYVTQPGHSVMYGGYGAATSFHASFSSVDNTINLG